LNDGPATRGSIAAVFDLTRPASLEALRRVVGEENVGQFGRPGKPLVVLVVEGQQEGQQEGEHGELARLAFEGADELLKFYLSTLRANTKLAQRQRVQFVLRDLAPELEETLRQATRDLAVELQGPQGSA
jgi:hypothetical protein